MHVTDLPQLYRNLNRWRQIFAVLRRYGLADWLSHFKSLPGVSWLRTQQGESIAEMSREQRIRSALTELGPTFIKLGQLLSSRPDLIGADLARELRRLQSDVAADPPEQIEETLKNELGSRFGTILVDVSREPLAAASIGQVHRARLQDGTPVVVKVQRQHIEETVHRDLEVLAGLAQLADRVPALSAWGPSELVRQIGPMLRRELNFQRERQHMELFAELLKDHKDIRIPRPVSELCTRRVLVMDALEGVSLNAAWLVTDDQHAWALRLARCYSEMIFTHGVFHADPHAGNLLRLNDGRLGVLDFGMVGRIDDRLRDQIELMLVAIAAGDGQLLTRLVRRAGRAPATLDESRLAVDVADYLGMYGRQRLDQFDLLGALNELSDLLYRHGIQLPNQAALLLKMLISLEGTLKSLDANFSTLEVLQASLRKAILRRLSPRRRLHQLRRIYVEGEYLLDTLPDQLVGALEQVRTGRLSAQLELHRLGPPVNRLVMGMVASAVFLGASLMLAMKTPPLLFANSGRWLNDLSAPGFLGMVAALLIIMRLVRAIGLSGHLDRGD